MRSLRRFFLSTLVGSFLVSMAAEPFRVATYNVENYLDAAIGTREVKSERARAKVREAILALQPDILALQEMGQPSALKELRDALATHGLDYPYWEHAGGWDTNIFVAVLSRFPIVARRSHTNDNYLLQGRRFQVSRAFIEVEVAVAEDYRLTVMTAHLKSRREVPWADQADMRLAEARLLREKVDAVFDRDPNANLVVLGDFNDTKNTPSTRAVIGSGKFRLVDTRPAERNGDNEPAPRPTWDPRNVTWTHFYGVEDSYQRIDYLLISPGLAREWLPAETYVLTLPNWGIGSDHRPIVAAFAPEDR